MKISDENVSKSTRRVATLTEQEAGALYCRERWDRDWVAHAQAEWDLSPGRARGLVYGTATQSTFDLIKAHPRGGQAVGLAILALTWQLSTRNFIDNIIAGEAEKLDHEHARIEQARADLAALDRRISGLRHG